MLVPIAIRLSFYFLFEWSLSKEQYSFSEQAFTEMEKFYVIREDCCGRWRRLLEES